jgi:AraC family transcriptional regulator
MDGMRVPAHMIRKNIARGRYACITHTGKMSYLKSTVNIIYRRMLPERNLTPESAQKAGLIQFERYDNRFHWNRPDSIIEIYVPLETAAGKMEL